MTRDEESLTSQLTQGGAVREREGFGVDESLQEKEDATGAFHGRGVYNRLRLNKLVVDDQFMAASFEFEMSSFGVSKISSNCKHRVLLHALVVGRINWDHGRIVS